ncbi:helix-turn-helix transcriptional regulator [Arenibacter algicola]|uniref:helix-turn-helix transcriptional regulator n=1 Tax=Arenibacter algicola TaxID=616991 RepID=UPI0004DF2263|nr:helix-turn-helix domain protein [Arenibacter sp. NBRC 103722]
MKKQFLSRQQVAEMLGISLVTLHNHNKKGILKPTHKIGRKPLYLLEDIMEKIQLSNYKTIT